MILDFLPFRALRIVMVLRVITLSFGNSGSGQIVWGDGRR